MKRVISLFLAACLIVATLAAPALAAETVPASVYDLLNDVDYRLFFGTENQGTYSEPLAEISTDAVTWRWNVLSNQVYSTVTVSIIADSKPSAVSLYFDGAYSSLSFQYSQGNIFYYLLEKEVVFDDTEIRLRATWSDVYTGLFGVNAFYGYVDHSISVETADTFFNVLIGDPSLGFRTPVVVDSGENVSIPMGADWYGPYEYETDEELLYGEVYYKVACPISRVKSVTFMVYTVGGIDTLGARLERADGWSLTGLSCDVLYCGENQIVVEFQEDMYRCHVYMVTVDLSGHDLQDVVVSLSYHVQPVHSSAFIEYGWGVYSSLNACVFLPEVSDLPWYAGYADWLSVYLDKINSGISAVSSALATWGANVRDGIVAAVDKSTTAVTTWGTNVRDAVENTTSAVVTWGINVRDGVVAAVNKATTAVTTWGTNVRDAVERTTSAVIVWGTNIRDDVVAAVNDTTSMVAFWGKSILEALTPPDPGFDEFQEDLSQAEDELQHVGDVMDSVTRPNINDINPDVSNIVKPADVTLLASPLTVVFDNPYIMSMFVLSFTMALAGFVLYGKR